MGRGLAGFYGLRFNALYLCYYLKLWGCLHDALLRLVGLNNTFQKPNSSRETGDSVIACIFSSSSAVGKAGKRMF